MGFARKAPTTDRRVERNGVVVRTKAPSAGLKRSDHLIATTATAQVGGRLVLLRDVENAALEVARNDVAELRSNNFNSAHGDLRLEEYCRRSCSC